MKYLCDGRWLSDEEFAEWIADRSVYELSELTCESIPYTLQMLELCNGLADKAQILYVETRAK